MRAAGHDAVADEVGRLLGALAPVLPRDVGLDEAAVVRAAGPGDDLARWARSGAMALTGRADGPPAAPAAPVAARLAAAGAVLAAVTDRLGRRVEVDAPALLGERAALRGLARNGATSVGGHARLLPARDGWVAVSLARPDDWSLVPAWLEADVDGWDGIAAAVATRPAVGVAARAGELGLAAATVPPPSGPDDEQHRVRHGATATGVPWLVTRTDHVGRRRSRPLRVVDLSALWAGPLCAHLMALAGADVVTVEDPDRTDGSRRGDSRLHALLHAGHDLAAVAIGTADGRDRLRALVAGADVVVSGSRPRALRQLGLDPVATTHTTPGLTWVAITGYGLTGPWADRIGYGDDAAAGGGLVVGADPPLFCADAAADPATGLYAAIAGIATALGGGGVVDVALRDVAAHLARPPFAVGPRTAAWADEGWVVTTGDRAVPVAAPRARATADA